MVILTHLPLYPAGEYRVRLFTFYYQIETRMVYAKIKKLLRVVRSLLINLIPGVYGFSGLKFRSCERRFHGDNDLFSFHRVWYSRS